MKRILILLPLLLLTACTPAATEQLEGLIPTGSMALSYAEQFSVTYYEGGYAEINIADGSAFLLVPEGVPVPEDAGNYVILQQPLHDLYVAASSAVDLFDGIGSLDAVTMTSTKDWTLPAVQEALDSGSLQYVGKYNAPDYELLLENDCSLAIESTMIYHSPETREQLEQLGIPVLTERSSYEAHPLGRMEWLKLYGLLLGKTDEAESFFSEKTARFAEIAPEQIPEAERKTAVFFYISPNGYVNIRKPGDYISEMITLAGGRYAFTADALNVEENALSTMNIQMEVFYETAKDADVFIYNSTVEGELQSLSALIDKSPVLADCKAVQNGAVWCTGQNMYQQTTGAADMLCDLHAVLTGDTEAELTFLHHLE